MSETHSTPATPRSKPAKPCPEYRSQEQLCKAESCAIQRKEEGVLPHPRQYKAGLAMPRRTLSPQDLQELRELAARWGQIVARHAFGDAGPGTDVDLDAMEQVAAAAAAGLTEGTRATLLEQQAHLLGTEQPCPGCGRLCAVRRAERSLNVRAGPVTQR